MKYNFKADKKNTESLTFSDLTAGDVFIILNTIGIENDIGHIYIKTSHDVISHNKILGRAVLDNAISLKNGEPIRVHETIKVAKLITPITFYEDDFVETK